MNKDIFQGSWLKVKGEVKSKWGKLTDDDLTRINGNREILLGDLQKKYGIAKDEAEKQLKAFEDEYSRTEKRAA